MGKTVDTLFNAIYGKEDISNGAIADYIGNCNVDLGIKLWSGLIKNKGVTKELAENCFKTNRIDLLVKAKNKYKPSTYFNDYLNSKSKLGGVFMQTRSVRSPEQLPIYDDNHCPSCNCANYNENIISPPDCPGCYKIICKECGIYNKKNDYWECKYCFKD